MLIGRLHQLMACGLVISIDDDDLYSARPIPQGYYLRLSDTFNLQCPLQIMIRIATGGRCPDFDQIPAAQGIIAFLIESIVGGIFISDILYSIYAYGDFGDFTGRHISYAACLFCGCPHLCGAIFTYNRIFHRGKVYPIRRGKHAAGRNSCPLVAIYGQNHSSKCSILPDNAKRLCQPGKIYSPAGLGECRIHHQGHFSVGFFKFNRIGTQ